MCVHICIMAFSFVFLWDSCELEQMCLSIYVCFYVFSFGSFLLFVCLILFYFILSLFLRCLVFSNKRQKWYGSRWKREEEWG